MTLRDLFRWAERYRQAEELHVTRGAKYFDWDQYIAEQGAFFLRLMRTTRNSSFAFVLICAAGLSYT